jgi:hypothetical protein
MKMTDLAENSRFIFEFVRAIPGMRPAALHLA